MSPRERMVAAYRGLPVDSVPVAPEFWYYIPARVLGVDMTAFERQVPLWEAHQRTFARYGTEGWSVTGPSIPAPGVRSREEWVDIGGGRFESRVITDTLHGTLRSRSLFDRREPSSPIERAIKDFAADWPAYEAASLGVVEEADWSGVRSALAAVGDDYLLEVGVGVPFFDYIALGREGGPTQALFDLTDHAEYLEALHGRYVAHARRLARAACEHTAAEALFIGCAWSCLSVLSPDLWRRWDAPVIRAVADEAHRAGRLLHVHLHGRCAAIVADLPATGVDCVCPFERPPGGDTTDLSVVREHLGDRVTVNGNVHTVETLIRGGPDDVARQVEGIFDEWGSPPSRLILGTGDQVGWETPEANIAAMVETGRRLGSEAARRAWG